jgi:hypothetical protein
MTHFCVVIGCKNVKIGDTQAVEWNGRCPVHGAPLVNSARPWDLRHAMPEGATPNVVEAVTATLAQTQTPLPPPRLSFADLVARGAPIASSPTPVAQPRFRGCTYGALGTFNCSYCQQGSDEAEHVPTLPESRQTRDKAAKFVAACEERQKREEDAYKGPKHAAKGYMVGVLELGSKFYVAISGGDSCMPTGAQKMANKHGLIIVDSLPAKVTAKKRDIDTSNIKKTGVAEFFECAGPKLVGYILDQLSPRAPSSWYLTEMWFGPASGNEHTHGVVYESCGNCRVILPMMLCCGSKPTSGHKTARKKGDGSDKPY